MERRKVIASTTNKMAGVCMRYQEEKGSFLVYCNSANSKKVGLFSQLGHQSHFQISGVCVIAAPAAAAAAACAFSEPREVNEK